MADAWSEIAAEFVHLAGDEAANTESAAIVDVTDPARASRRYADLCTCDIGERW